MLHIPELLHKAVTAVVKVGNLSP